MVPSGMFDTSATSEHPLSVGQSSDARLDRRKSNDIKVCGIFSFLDAFLKIIFKFTMPRNMFFTFFLKQFVDTFLAAQLENQHFGGKNMEK